MIQNWLQILIFLSYECMVVGLDVDKFTQVFTEPLIHEGSLTKELIIKRLLTFGVDGVSISKRLHQTILNRLQKVRLHIPLGFIIWFT